jgi:hypothetical protein
MFATRRTRSWKRFGRQVRPLRFVAKRCASGMERRFSARPAMLDEDFKDLQKPLK